MLNFSKSLSRYLTRSRFSVTLFCFVCSQSRFIILLCCQSRYLFLTVVSHAVLFFSVSCYRCLALLFSHYNLLLWSHSCWPVLFWSPLSFLVLLWSSLFRSSSLDALHSLWQSRRRISGVSTDGTTVRQDPLSWIVTKSGSASICPSVFLSNCLFVCLIVCLSVYLSIYLV